MKKIFLLLSLVITLSSCKRNCDLITIEGESQTVFDDKYVYFDKGWFVNTKDIVVDYKNKTVTLKIEKADGAKVIR